mmetsp:Transcript_7057/g.23170  ORF Transcript_7057/g.23170 Transcript_7057/m.23170 type:complete len:127 (+) Transcript_7057:225-605(+)
MTDFAAELRDVKDKIAKVEAKMENVEAALGGRADGAGDYVRYAKMEDFTEVRSALEPIHKDLADQLVRLEAKEKLLRTLVRKHPRRRSPLPPILEADQAEPSIPDVDPQSCNPLIAPRMHLTPEIV